MNQKSRDKHISGGHLLICIVSPFFTLPKVSSKYALDIFRNPQDLNHFNLFFLDNVECITML